MHQSPSVSRAAAVGSCKFLILLLLFGSSAESANILFYFGVASYSHRISVWPLVTSLADKGHNVTFSTIYPPKSEHKHPKVKEFLPKEYEEKVGEMFVDFGDLITNRVKDGRMSSMSLAAQLPKFGHDVCEIFLSTKATQDWIQHSHFDLIVIDALYNDCAYGLAHKFNAKTIIFGTTSVFSWWHDLFGFPSESSWISEMHVSFPYPMTFGERIISTVLPLIQYFDNIWRYYPKMDALFKEKFNDPNFPSLAELERNTSLILLSSHYSEEFARSLPPFVIPVGGIHLDTDKRDRTKDLPKDILKFMDESGSIGFIYISFGSASQISNAPKEIQNVFFTALKNSKARFLWKWEAERPAEMPDNVLTAKWMPQQQILVHPKLKAFMTHAGLMGLTEAITAGVPLIMFPIFAEQDYNSFRFEREGRGIRLEIATLTLPKLEVALQEILTNQIYKKNMLKTMKLYKDRPLTPLQTAVWWTEYVLRNEDVSSLKPLAMNQTWYERRLLDVWAFILIFLLIILLVPLYIIKKLVTCLFFNKSVVKSKSSKNGKLKSS